MYMDVYYENKKYKVDDENVSNIDFLKFKTVKAVIVTEEEEKIEVFWNSVTWKWDKIEVKTEFEKRLNNKIKDVYFNEKLYLVPKSRIRTHFNKELDDTVQIAHLPIDIHVYWNEKTNSWQFYDE